MLIRVLAVAVVATALCSAAIAAAASLHTGHLSPDRYTWSITDGGDYRLELDGGRPLGVTDQPDLPGLDLLLLVPADLPIADVGIEPITVRRLPLPGRLAVAAPLVSSNGEVLPRHHLQPVDGAFPATWGQFGGLHDWRGYRLLAVNLHPFRVVETPDGPVLEVLEDYRITVVSDGAPARDAPLVRQRRVPGEREQLEAALRKVVANPGSVAGYARADGVDAAVAGEAFLPAPIPSLDGSAVRYLIVTSDALAGEFQRLADHRTAQGMPALVVTMEWIAAHYRAGADLAETIRFFLKDAYTKWGMEYVLLGGDTGVVPARMIRSWFYPYGGHTDLPTDAYYAGLDGTWAADGDGWFAEPYISLDNPGDQADLALDVSLGRAPVRSALEAAQFVDKMIGYEMVPAGAAWPERFLFAAEVLFPADWPVHPTITLDGAQFAHRLITEAIEPCTSMDYTRLYETDELFPRDAPLTRAALIDSLNTGHYGQVSQFGHGHYFNMSVGDANFTVGDAAALHNPNPFLLFALNCASGAFDLSCLLESFVQNPDGGAIMAFGAAREAFPSNSFAYQAMTYDQVMCGGDPHVVTAFTLARLAYVGNTERNTLDRWTQLNAVVIGDPAIGLWSASPRTPAIVAPSSLTAGEQAVAVTVNVGAAPITGADVCLAKAGETYAYGTTDGAGQAVLTVTPATAGAMTLTVSGKGLARTVQTIAVAGAASYLQLTDLVVDDGSANGDGLADAGEVCALDLTFTDVGGAGASGLSVELSCGATELVLLTTTADLADCAPGGTTSTLTPLAVRTDPSLRDGTSFDLAFEVSDGVTSWVSHHRLDVTAPEPALAELLVDDSVYGDGDGEVEAGERIVIRPRLKNFGGGRLDQLACQLIEPAAGVVLNSAFALVTGLGSLEQGEPSVGELSLTLADPNVAAPARLTFQDNYGRAFSVVLGFQAVTPPAAPVADATVAPDAMALRWDPSGDADVIGYHVYRASAAEGPFVRANQDLLEGLAYYQDRGLDQLTYYWYKVTAVDSHYTESDFSGVTIQTTMPAELGNFPLSFAVPTSSHPAVGDIDGDGRPEIVLAADEVYAWHDDGTEVLDGDNDAQTTGPFTGIDGLFGPAGVALADLVGDRALEIIVSERVAQPRILVYRGDGTLLPGWPIDLVSSWNWAAPSVGDVDGDGDAEVVVNDTGGRLFVWHHDGTELADGDGDPGTNGVLVDRPDSWALSSPALHDLDGDGACEMIYGSRVYTGDNVLLAYRYDGTQAAGFPFATGNGAIICSPAIADLDRDGLKEIIFFTTSRQLYVLRQDGSLYPGFPVTHDTEYDESAGPSPAVGNFDGDADLEILWPVNAGSFRMDLLVIDTDIDGGTSGDVMPGWPVQLPANSEGSPVVGDLDGDGRADIVQPIGSDETETPDLIMAFKATGEGLAGFPIALGGHCRSTPVICDLDLDGDVDLVYGAYDLGLHAWDMPAPYDPTLVPWPTFQGTPARTGVAYQFSVTPVTEDVPGVFTVLPPWPNPFNPSTTIRLYVTPGEDQRVEVKLYDLSGRLVRRLFAGERRPGWHEFVWDGRDDRGRGLASGVYVGRARQSRVTQAFKLTLVK